MADNIYIHFPFCRSRCSYCALYSRTGSTTASLAEYVESLKGELEPLKVRLPTLKTIYFGGGSPALCDLKPLKSVLNSLCDETTEFTVELHPLDVTDTKLDELKAVGVNRISMGVQSLDDNTLKAMGRGYTADIAARAFANVKRRFDNAGVDLIVGYPGDAERETKLDSLKNWGLAHCSVYSLQNERCLKNVPCDDIVLDRIRSIAAFLETLGLARYEISNYAVPGFECRHNLAVWRGEDYIGLGEGAYGREGVNRTRGVRRGGAGEGKPGIAYETTIVSPADDLKERTLFRLRTRDGIETLRFPEWRPTLDRFVGEGLLVHIDDTAYRLTERGTEVCDSILAEIV